MYQSSSIRRLIYVIAAFIFSVAYYRSNGQDHSALPSAVNGSVPFSQPDFNDNSSKVQFAIISDLWGGYRKGVFEDAVSKLELLQPQFVMSVGDLIDGKTYDTVLINMQWQDFQLHLKPLTMPFFYVVGNHDIANPVMENIWKEKFGHTYYYFVYKNVLFFCVNTQDNNGFDGISDAQVEYFKKALQSHPDARWTFIFMHRPVWNDKNEQGFEKIEALFDGHNFTVFSGHHHTYMHKNKNGIKYFMLATTGGASDLFGSKYGLSDQLTWVTLNKNEEPKIINIELGGLLKEDIVTDKIDSLTSTLVYQKWLITPSFVAQNQFEESIDPFIVFQNPNTHPLKISGRLSKDKRYHIHPEMINVTIPPQSSDTQRLKVTSSSGSKMDFSKLSTIKFDLNGAYKYDTTHYELPAKKDLLLSWKYILPGRKNAKKESEENFKSGDTSGLITIRQPEYLENHWYWSGPADGMIQFKFYHDKKYVYLNVFIHDDQLVNLKNKGDRLNIFFEDKAGNHVVCTIDPFDKIKNISAIGKDNLSAKNWQLKNEVVGDHLIKIRLQIPKNDIARSDRSFRFNIGYYDLDTQPESHYSIIFWKPRWGTKSDYKNSGTFILDDDESNL